MLPRRGPDPIGRRGGRPRCRGISTARIQQVPVVRHHYSRDRRGSLLRSGHSRRRPSTGRERWSGSSRVTSFLPSMRGPQRSCGCCEAEFGRRTSRRDPGFAPSCCPEACSARRPSWWSHASTVSLLIRRKVRDSRPGGPAGPSPARPTHRRGAAPGIVCASPCSSGTISSFANGIAAETLYLGPSVRAARPDLASLPEMARALPLADPLPPGPLRPLRTRALASVDGAA